MQDQNGDLDLTQAWDRPIEPDEYNAPANSWEDRAIRQALVVITMNRSAVRRLVAPPLPQVGPRPPHHRDAIGIEDVMTAARPVGESTNFSGTSAGYSGSTRNGWGGPQYG